MVFLISLEVNIIGSEGGSSFTIPGGDEIGRELTINFLEHIYYVLGLPRSPDHDSKVFVHFQKSQKLLVL